MTINPIGMNDNVCTRTVASDTFPYVNSSLRWTAPDNMTTVCITRSYFTWMVNVCIGTYRVDEMYYTCDTEDSARAVAYSYALLIRECGISTIMQIICDNID